MKKAKDRFSGLSEKNQKYRPVYPEDLYNYILSLVKCNESAWDAGTGNGQVAHRLASNFSSVHATDIRQDQIDRASKHVRVHYAVKRSEQTTFSDQSMDLITVAQALHSYDIPHFIDAVKRVRKSGSILTLTAVTCLDIRFNLKSLIMPT